MTREEFSSRLVRCRQEAQGSKYERCRRSGFPYTQIQRIEKASANISIDIVLLYLKTTGYGTYTFQRGKKYLFDS